MVYLIELITDLPGYFWDSLVLSFPSRDAAVAALLAHGFSPPLTRENRFLPMYKTVHGCEVEADMYRGPEECPGDCVLDRLDALVQGELEKLRD